MSFSDSANRLSYFDFSFEGPAHPAQWRVGGARGGGNRNRTLYLLDFGNPNDIAQCLHLSFERCLAMGHGQQFGGGWGVYDEVRFEHERCVF